MLCEIYKYIPANLERIIITLGTYVDQRKHVMKAVERLYMRSQFITKQFKTLKQKCLRKLYLLVSSVVFFFRVALGYVLFLIYIYINVFIKKTLVRKANKINFQIAMIYFSFFLNEKINFSKTLNLKLKTVSVNIKRLD